MFGKKTSHITVTTKLESRWVGGGDLDGYWSPVVECIYVYAVSKKITRKLGWKRNWLGWKPSGEKLKEWLEENGCQLDSDGGPALVRHETEDCGCCIYKTDMTQSYYRDGKLDREDGPAVVRRLADGSTREEYWRDGEFAKEERLAPLSAIPGVTVRPGMPKATEKQGPRPV
jgi:hypothetical protein